MRRLSVLVLLAALAIAPVAPAVAVRETSRTRIIPGYVVLPLRLAPRFTPTRASRALRVTVTQSGCGPRYDHPVLAWSARRLTVTLLARPDGPVSERTHVACPDYIALIPITVPLGRKLGARAIYDGGLVPPRLVERAPA
jgi:hypothetical protein